MFEKRKKGDSHRLHANCGPERRVTEIRTSVEKRPCEMPRPGRARRKRRRRSLTLERTNRAPAGEFYDKHPKTWSRPQALPPKYGQMAITWGENQGQATIHKANHFKPTPEILYIQKKWVNDYITRENKIHFDDPIQNRPFLSFCHSPPILF